jgi:stage II sporulation protein D
MTLIHDCCGGWIESIVNSYPIEKAKPYLITQQDGLPPFCGISDDFSWTVQFTSETILQNLRSMGKLDNNVNVLKDIKITETFPSGRVKTITVTAGTGNIITLPAGSIEDVFKKPDDEHNHINSTLFELLTTKQGDAVEKVVLIGKGSGSGAGMCIWGAMGRARDGWNYKDILSFYFPGTTLNK